MPYTIYDAIKDEIDFLKTLEKVEKNDKHTITAAIIYQQRASLNRILRRVDSGYDYRIERDTVTGKPGITYYKSDRKRLEDEYPALRKAAEQYNIVKDLIDSTPD